VSGIIVTVPEILLYTVAVVPPGILDSIVLEWGRVTLVLKIKLRGKFNRVGLEKKIILM
jgi:hypothetical protein